MLSVVISVDHEIVEGDDLRHLLEFAFDRLPSFPPGHWEATVRLADGDEIVRLHDRFFGNPDETDVMSFPSGEVDDTSNGRGGYLGDIAISVRVSAAQATEHGHSHLRELCFLALHGLLHLVGYHDGTPDERDAMLALQSSLLETFEISSGRNL